MIKHKKHSDLKVRFLHWFWKQTFAFGIVYLFGITQVIGQRTEVKVPFDSTESFFKEIYFILDTQGSKIYDGPYEAFFTNGELKTSGNYKLGYPDSIWSYYYQGGQVKIKTDYDTIPGKEHWVYFFENGNIQKQGPIVEGKRNGLWDYQYESGVRKEFGRYLQGFKDGTWNYFYEDGSLKGKAFYKKGDGWYEEFYPTGELAVKGYVKGGKSDSTWIYYFKSGAVRAEGLEKNGLKTGPWKYYHENGQVQAEGDYVDGLKTGPWKYYFETGAVKRKGQMVGDREDGYWKMFYEDGSVLGEGNYDEGSGSYKEFYPSGKIKIKGQKKEGRYEGRWEYFYEEGTLEGRADFAYGRGYYVGFYPDGKRKMTGVLENGEKVGQWKLFNPDGTLAGTFERIAGQEEPVLEPLEEEPEKKELAINNPPKSKFKYKTRKRNKFFTPKMNEYRSFIAGLNPLSPFFGSLPLTLEYYYQERLGYELFVVLLRDPFLTPQSNVPEYKLYNQGFSLGLKQKMYFDKNLYGLIYFGHEIRYTLNDHFMNLPENDDPGFRPNIEQSLIEYSIFVGDRVFQSTANKGFTLDLWAGIGIGYRSSTKNWEDDPRLDELFSGVNQSELTVPIRIGVTIGYMFKYNPSPLYQTK